MGRREKGREIRQEIFGTVPGAAGPLTEDIMALTNDYLFGEIWSRPGLSLRERSLITVSVLTAFGKEPQLKVHLKGALNLGHTPEALKELMIHVTHYAGWPTGINGLKVLGEVLKEQGIDYPRDEV